MKAQREVKFPAAARLFDRGVCFPGFKCCARVATRTHDNKTTNMMMEGREQGSHVTGAGLSQWNKDFFGNVFSTKALVFVVRARDASGSTKNTFFCLTLRVV